MNIVKCNKCPFTSPNEKMFATLFVHIPKTEKQKTMKEMFADREKMLTEADFINAGLQPDPEMLYQDYITIHLCPQHTQWFQGQFDLQKRRMKK